VPLRAAAEVAEVDRRLLLVAGSEAEACQLPGTVFVVPAGSASEPSQRRCLVNFSLRSF
jgi:hypothetical protein